MIPAVLARCAGIDVGKTFVVVCVMVGPADSEPQVEQRTYDTTNEELEKLRQWLVETECTHVAIESTGSYWQALIR